MPSRKPYLSLTEIEIQRLAKLTPREKSAIDAFVAAAMALPRGITIYLEDFGGRNDGISINKKITTGACQQVARVKKPSLIF